MSEIKIGTLNLKNNSVNRSGGHEERTGLDNSEIVAQNIKQQNFDILGVQELTKGFSNSIFSHIHNFKFYGEYRYGAGLLSKLPLFKTWNENNNIITPNEVLSDETYKLPFVPKNLGDLAKSVTKMSLMPRIATIIISQDIEGNLLCSINTHLDYQLKSVQIEQLNYLKNLIQKYSLEYPITLTGDFNMEVSQPHMKKFVEDLEGLGLQRVQINESTHKEHNEAIDHIFIPKNWEITSAGVVEDSNLKNVTDHKEIYVSSKRVK